MYKVSQALKSLTGIFFLTLFLTDTYGQSNISLKYFGLTIHPFGDQLAHIQPYRLDDKAYFVLNIGGFVKYERYIWEDILTLNIAQGVFSDCSAGLASVSSLGFHLLIKEKERHHFYIDIGSALFFREDWNRFDDYKDSGGYKKLSYANKNWQYGLYPVSAMFEYDYSISDKTNFSVSLAPYPVIAIGMGIKYWFSKNFKHSSKILIPK